MNYFSMFTALIAIAALATPGAACAAQGNDRVYDMIYTVTPDPGKASASVQLHVQQPRSLLREMRMQIDPERISDVTGSGIINVGVDEIRWTPTPTGGTLSWTVSIPHERNNNGHDAWLADDWGVFRAEDIIPRAATRTLRGSKSNTTLNFRLPRGWSVVTEYFGNDSSFKVQRPERLFDQPAGWIAMGELGVRRDEIAGTRVAVAAPVNQTNRRLEMLALLRWTLPELARIVPKLPRRLTIVSAGEPMWRGALSAPASLFIQAERPLISENATSTLLHEVMHVSTGMSSEYGYDWIVEGIAEYYSLELLRRSDSISEKRYLDARRSQRAWGKKATTLCAPSSSGATTALAVTTLTALDRELRAASGGDVTLDDVTAELLARGEALNLERLRRAAESVGGDSIETLHTDKLPGCSDNGRENSQLSN
ncbi:MAG: hypothetical protein WBN09_06360 [Woeseiaceae bacterium]